MSKRRNCWDNAPHENFFEHMKEEVNFDNKSHEEIVLMVNNWMNYYNDRLQRKLAKLSPNNEYWEYITTGEYPQILKSQGFTLKI